MLVELPAPADVLALLRRLQAARAAPGAPPLEDLVPAERTLLVRFDSRRTSCPQVREWLAGVPSSEVPSSPERSAVAEGPRRAGAVVELPVVYDGADLDDVGRLTGLGADGVVAAHTGTPWTVAFTGFAPGFGYLVGGDPRLAVPRLATPRVRVPAGSVALAGAYSGVYPRESPGGWRLLGATTRRIWDLHQDPPALLRPGVVVRFVAVESTGTGRD